MTRTMHIHQNPTCLKLQRMGGFSLLELAIALAVLAVLAGGILKGSELLTSAKVQSTATELAALETATASFEARYNALPGDFAGASAAGLASGNANGNGLIDNGTEEGLVFAQLQQAGFLKGQYTAQTLTSGNCSPEVCATSPLGGTFLISHLLQGVSTPANALLTTLGRPASPKQLAELDRKLDDGKANRGVLQLMTGQPEGCVTGNGALWNEQSDEVCLAVYQLR